MNLVQMTQEICRICEDGSSNNLKYLLSDENVDLVFKIISCANVTINSSDHLPKFICGTCENNLEIAYQFKEQCEFNDRKWRNFIASFSSSSSSIEDVNHYDGRQSSNENYETAKNEYNNCNELGENDFEGDVENLRNLTNTTQIQFSHDSKLKGHHEYQQVDQLNFEYLVETDLEDDNQIFANDDDDNDDDKNYIIKEEYIENEDYNDDDINLVIEEVDFKEIDSATNDTENIQSNTKFILIPNLSNMFHCDTCSETFLSYVDFNNHKKSHGNQRYQCPKCLKWFSKRFRLKNHLIIHEENKKLYKCDKCDNTYSNQGNLGRHIRHFHNKVRPFVCTICGVSFSRSLTFRVHQSVHTKERNYQCDICEKKFKALYYLQVHKKTHLPKKLCKKSSTSEVKERNRNKENKKSSSSKTDKNIECQYCGKLSKTKSSHLSHVRMHTGEKPFICKYCGKAFAFRPSLRVHEFVHTGEKPYKCKICGLQFRQFGHLKSHNLIHAGIKNHKCNYCDKTFALKSNLVVHLRMHTGEQPYECSICYRKFSDINSFKKHKESAHNYIQNDYGNDGLTSGK